MKFTSMALVSLFLVGGYSTAMAQRTGTQAHPAHPAAKPESKPAGGPKTEAHAVKSFKGVASKLGTTPQALEDAYEAAKQANPKLTRGQFVAANMLAHNLGDKNASITTQAILDGLKSGNSIGKTLQNLGLSADQAKEAERTADRDAKNAEKGEGKKPSGA